MNELQPSCRCIAHTCPEPAEPSGLCIGCQLVHDTGGECKLPEEEEAASFDSQEEELTVDVYNSPIEIKEAIDKAAADLL